MLEQGPHEVMIAQQSVRMGQPLPARIANAPELMLGLQVYLQAFFDLDSERSHANGYTLIPWSSIYSYAQTLDFDDEQTEDLIYLIRRLDSEHVKRLAAKHGA